MKIPVWTIIKLFLGIGQKKEDERQLPLWQHRRVISIGVIGAGMVWQMLNANTIISKDVIDTFFDNAILVLTSVKAAIDSGDLSTKVYNLKIAAGGLFALYGLVLHGAGWIFKKKSIPVAVTTPPIVQPEPIAPDKVESKEDRGHIEDIKPSDG